MNDQELRSTSVTIYCDSASHAGEELEVRRFLLLDTRDGQMTLWPSSDQILIGDHPERSVRELRKGKADARSRYELRCDVCRGRSPSRADAAPVVVRGEKIRPILESLARYGVTRLSLAGLKGRVYQ